MTFFGRGFGSAGILCAALASLAPAQAQDFPNRPVRMIVGLPAGGGTDVQARLVAQKMAENMKTTVVVENKPGGNFIPAARELAGSPPDGHTLYFISSSSLITQAIHPDYPIDLLKFTPVTEVSTGPLILVARNDLGVKTVGELREKSDKELLSLQNLGPGSVNHLRETLGLPSHAGVRPISGSKPG